MTMSELADLQAQLNRLQRSQRRMVRIIAVLLVAAVASVILVAQDRRRQPVTASSFVVLKPDGTVGAVLGPDGLSLSADGRRTRTQITPGSIALADPAGREGVRLEAGAVASSLAIRTPGSADAAPSGLIDAAATPDGRAALRVTSGGQRHFATGSPADPDAGEDTDTGEDPRWAGARVLAEQVRKAMNHWAAAHNGRLVDLVQTGQGFSLADGRERLGIGAASIHAVRYFGARDFTIFIDSVDEARFRIVVRGSLRHSPGGTLTVWQDGRSQLEK